MSSLSPPFADLTPDALTPVAAHATGRLRPRCTGCRAAVAWRAVKAYTGPTGAVYLCPECERDFRHAAATRRAVAARVDMCTSDLPDSLWGQIADRCGPGIVAATDAARLVAPMAHQAPSAAGEPSGVWLRFPGLRDGQADGPVAVTIDPPSAWVARFAAHTVDRGEPGGRKTPPPATGLPDPPPVR